MLGSQGQFSSTLQFWNAKSKECRIPPFPPGLSISHKDGAYYSNQQAQPSLSRGGNKQYQCQSLSINKYRQVSPSKRFYQCENVFALGLKPSDITKRSISYQEPTQVQHEALYRRNFSNPSPIRVPSKLVTKGSPLYIPSIPSDTSLSQDNSSPALSRSVDVNDIGSFGNWPQPKIQSIQHSTPQLSTPVHNTATYTESLSSLSILKLPSTQSGSVSSRHSFDYKDFETHTPVLEILSPIPRKPWKLREFIELHGGGSGSYIDNHATVFDDESKCKKLLQEEKHRETQMGKGTTIMISSSRPGARELVATISEVEPEPELQFVEGEAIDNDDDTVMKYLESDDSTESLQDSVEDERDEVWRRIDNSVTMCEIELDRWQPGDELISNEALSIAVNKILRVTNPNVSNIRGSLDSLGYVKHHTTPEASSIDISILEDISFEEPNIASVLMAIESTASLVTPSGHPAKIQARHSRKRKSETPIPPRRTLYERISHPVRSRLSPPTIPSTPINLVRTRFAIEDSPKAENRPPTKKQKTNKRNSCKGEPSESGSVSSVTKPFRRALMSLSLRKYAINNTSSESLKKSSSKSEGKKENEPVDGTDIKVKKSKKIHIDGFWGSFLHAI